MGARLGLMAFAVAAVAFGVSVRTAFPGDPATNRSRFLGGDGTDLCAAAATGADGSTYVAGTTTSAGFDGAQGVSVETAFLAKLAHDGATIWVRRLAGDVVHGRCVAVAPDGSVRIGGDVLTPAFAATSRTGTGGNYDGFVATYSSAGTLLAIDLYGGPGEDSVDGVSVSPDGRTHVTGKGGAGFPTINPVVIPSATGSFDAWYARTGPSGAVEVVTLLAGTGDDRGRAVAAGANGDVAIGGITSSTNFLGSGGAGASGGNNTDGFVALFRRAQDGTTTLRFARTIGGNGFDFVNAVAMDGGTVLVAGSTDSAGLTSLGAFQRGNAGGDAFAARFGADGARQWLTYFGGAGPDEALSIAPMSGDVVVAGATRSALGADGFPVTASAFQPLRGGNTDAFLARFTADGSALAGSTLLGGPADDQANGLALAELDAITLVGVTASSTFFRQGSGDLVFDGANDGFVARVCPVRGSLIAANLTATLMTGAVTGASSDVRLNWTPAIGAAQQVVRRRSFNDGAAPIEALTGLPAGSTTYTDVAPARLNSEYWIETTDGTGRSTWSAGIRAAAGGGGVDTPPEAPDALSLTAAGAKVALTWRDLSIDETRFEIDRSIDGGPFSAVATTKANAMRLTLAHGGSPGAVLAFRVRAVNEAGSSAPSAAAGFRVIESYTLRARRGRADNGASDGRIAASGRYSIGSGRSFDPAQESLALRFASSVYPNEEAQITLPAGDLGWRAHRRWVVWDASRSALPNHPRGRIVLDERTRRFRIDLRGVDTPDFTTSGFPQVSARLELGLGDDYAVSEELWRFTRPNRRTIRLR